MRLAVGLLGFILGLGLGLAVGRWLEVAGERWDKMESGDKVTLFLGAFIGIFVSLPFFGLISPLGALLGSAVTVALMLGLSALAIYALKSMEEVLPWTRGRTKTRRRGIKILDTNAIIDGRIYDVARSGFLEGNIYVPGFVLEELQKIADSHDALRRQRGRRGLDILRHMRQEFQMDVGSQDRLAPDNSEDVDTRLIRWAKAIGGDVVTNDWNLNRVAKLQDVAVLNLNDLALALRPNVLPGEGLAVTPIREGNQPGQGVAYLDDGTMVVVEQGRRFIGETLTVLVTQVIQTERGKMIFAEVPAEGEPNAQPTKRQRGGH
jgi:uncharacterized protein YacL